MIEFFMPMAKVPTTTHQQKQVTVKNGKPIFYEPPDLVAARAKLTAHLWPNTPEKKFTGPVRLIAKWCFPLSGKHKDGEWKVTKPDVDNLQKLLLDCCTDLGFWSDDKLIVSMVVEKFYSKLPGIYIKIMEVD